MVSFILLLKSFGARRWNSNRVASHPGFSLRAILFINRQRFFRVKLIRLESFSAVIIGVVIYGQVT